jgi:hypothetical protein
VNNGFYEGQRNSLALEMMQNFCTRSELQWGQGVGVGGGGMIYTKSIGHGTMKNLGKALDVLAENIRSNSCAENCIVEPNFPKFLYKMVAHSLFKGKAKKNGVTRKELYNK